MKSRKMMAVFETIRILIVISFINVVCAQDEYGNHDILRLQQYAMNNGQGETITSFNAIQRDPKSSGNVQYHVTEEPNDGDYGTSVRGRNRKVYRIKNPFQQSEDVNASQETNYPQDSLIGASNQYPAVQYSLPPEGFLQQMRENQYQQQLSTPAPYTATPQSYQYSTVAAQSYDNIQQTNQISPVESKAYTPVYQTNANNFQYNQNAYNLNNQHSTPLPPYISTPSTQYIDSSANNYMSTSLPYVSSQQSLQQYVSSPMSHIQTGTFDYNNNRVTTLGSNAMNYDANEQNKRMQIDHYDNSINGIRYPLQSQYQNEYPSSTISPSSTQYPDSLRDSWQNALNALSKSEQAYVPVQYQNYRYNNNQQENRQQSNVDNSNNDNHRIGNMASANNIFVNYAQPDHQSYNMKGRAQDSEQETSPSEVYSHGDYGWKLSERKTSFGTEVSTNPNNYFKYQIHNLQPETGAVTQVNFQMDSSKPYNYDQNIKPVSEKLEPEEFARAAAKVHENYKQQLEASKYATNTQYNNNAMANSLSFYNYDDKQKTKLYNDNSYSFGNSQSELMTASPFYYLGHKDTNDAKSKPFDHDKALKNIVPIDVSNVLQNSDSQVKSNSELDTTNRYSLMNYNKDPTNSRPLSELYYKDKNSLYSFNVKTKPDDIIDSDKLRQFEQSSLFGKPYSSEGFYSHSFNSGNKRLVDEMTQSLSYPNQVSNSHQTNAQPSISNQQGLQQHSHMSSDYSNILKLNDLPYRLTQGFSSDNVRPHNSIPTPLPLRINQNVENHHIDVATEILNKLMGQKRNIPTINTNRPEIDSLTGNLISTINGFKVANPFNVDLKLVADMLKGKPTIDDSQMNSFRGDYSKSFPMKFDVSQLQQLLQLKNDNNAMGLNTGVSPLGNSYFDIYNGARFPYQGVKYSRSEEEPENIPIADSSNNHPIGAVIEESLNGQDAPELSESTEESLSADTEEDVLKTPYSLNRPLGRRQKHSDNGHTTRYTQKRKYPKPTTDTDEPYPLLKPPPPRTSRNRGFTKDKSTNRRRINRPKILRVFKTEPLFESGSDDFKYSLAQDKLDVVDEEDHS